MKKGTTYIKSRKYNMLGQKFGKLLVLKEILPEKKHHNGPIYECLCECGRVVIKSGLNIRNAKEPSCRLKYCSNREERLYLYLYGERVIRPSSQSGIPTDITYEKFKELISMPCSYCKRVGVQIQEDDLRGAKKLTDAFVRYNGLDQIRPRGGYTLNNIRTACFPCNQAKSNKLDGLMEKKMVVIHEFKPFRVLPDFSISDKIIWESCP